MSLLEVRDLTIRYGTEAVVENLSFTLEEAEAVGIVGESGSGKSQTALALLGLLPAAAAVSGSIRIDGKEVVACSARELNRLRAVRAGIVFQDPMQALNPYLRIGKQLRQVLVQHGLAAGKAANNRVIEMLARVGLADPERQFRAYPHELSGGMRQRVMIASVLLGRPALLIADEPTTALDVTVQAQILDLLEELRDDTALLLITHDLGIVAGRCERMLVFQSGKLVESGNTAAVFSAPQHEHTKRLLAATPRIDTGAVATAPTGSIVFRIDAAEVTYRDSRHQALSAVVGVSVALREGETLAIVGESGSGKSSLVRAALGLVAMQAGHVVYAGEPLQGLIDKRPHAQCRDLQLVFQDPLSALNPQMRVLQIVAEPLRVHEPAMSAEARDKRVLETLLQLGLAADIAARYPHQLSGGQAQRVAIARALILQPKVLICDEALAALDGSVREQILALLKAVQAQSGLSIIFISHDLAVVRAISHRVAVMYLGRIVESADSAALFATPRHPYTRALIDAVPIPDPKRPPASAPLQGEVPSLLTPPSGCVFHPRCAYADAHCSRLPPDTRDIGGSRVACHRAEELELALQ